MLPLRLLAKTNAHRLLPAFAVLAGLVWTSGCGDSPSGLPKPTRPVNILLISVDTLRADHTSAYGYARATTPTLEGLANAGVRFDSAYSPTATTAPTHASLFTSLYPPTHRVIKNGRVLAEEHRTLAEVLSSWGYQAGAVVSSYVLRHKFNYDQGFASWNDDFSAADSPAGVTAWLQESIKGKFYGQADDTTRRAVSWLEARSETQPFFLFVHYYDPHDPYDPPADWQTQFEATLGEQAHGGLDLLITRYDGEIGFTDQQIGGLLSALDRLGLSEETLVVVLGDHGEGLMEHGHLNHGVHIYEEAVRVPLIFRWPGFIEPGGSVATPVELTDVAPTILALVAPGIASSGSLPTPEADSLRDESGAASGRSLVPELSGAAETTSPSVQPPVYLYRRHYDGGMIMGTWAEGEKFGLRHEKWKYIRSEPSRSEELYDLEADPGETVNLAIEFPDVARRLSGTL